MQTETLYIYVNILYIIYIRFIYIGTRCINLCLKKTSKNIPDVMVRIQLNHDQSHLYTNRKHLELTFFFNHKITTNVTMKLRASYIFMQ